MLVFEEKNVFSFFRKKSFYLKEMSKMDVSIEHHYNVGSKMRGKKGRFRGQIS